jgi:hypothetical protein
MENHGKWGIPNTLDKRKDEECKIIWKKNENIENQIWYHIDSLPTTKTGFYPAVVWFWLLINGVK